MKRPPSRILPRALPGLVVLLLIPLAARAAGNRVVTGVDALRAEIAASRVATGEVLLFSPDDHLADLFLPLYRDKKVGALSVIVPSDTPMTDENLSAWKKYVATLAPGADNGFALKDGVFEGRVEGLPVRLASIRDWKGSSPGGTAILDLAFLVAMYEDEVRTPFVDLPRKFMATLEDRNLEPSHLRLWLSDRGAIPLANGYLVGLAGEISRNPAAFRKELPAKWEELRRGEYLAFFGAFEEAVPHFEKFLQEEPEEPGVLFRLAQASFVDREIERGIRLLRRACRKDPYYIRGFPQSALQFFRKGELENAERVIRAGLLMDPAVVDLKEGLAHVLLEQAKKLLARDAAAAERRFLEIDAVGLPDDVLAGLRKQWDAAKSNPARPVVPAGGMPHDHPKFQVEE